MGINRMINLAERIERAEELLEWDILYLEAISLCYKYSWEEKIAGLELAREKMKQEIMRLYPI
jgi:hypothetical protein